MIGSIALVLLVTFSGVIVSYLYDDDAPLSARLCAGACIGIAALGLVGFVLSSLQGLTTSAVYLTAFVLALPLIALARPRIANSFRYDLRSATGWSKQLFTHPNAASIGYVLFYLVVTVTLWKVFSRAMIEDEAGVGTGLLNNFGDLPFHLSVITGFAYGDNFPPQDPTYSGVHFTYPFISDFVSAIFVKCGADLRESIFIENIVLGISFVGLLHRWGLVMLRNHLAAVLTPLLVLLNGGFGWVLLINQAMASEKGLWGVLSDLPPSFTIIPETSWRWGNAISTLLVPQRGFLLGLPLAVIVFTQWWLAEDRVEKSALQGADEKKNPTHQRTLVDRANVFAKLRVTSQDQMIAAGILAGMLPLIHAHSFVVVMGMGGCLALLQRRWRDWISFFVAASVVALPQLWWSTSNSAVQASSFFAWEVGWDHGKVHPVWFWLKNTGLFIPLILVALLLRAKDYVVNRRLLLFYLPFVLCFIVPNFIKMAPWVWDNIKVLYYWWLASAPIVALLLASLWRQGGVRRAIALVLFVCVTFAGALDVAGIALRSTTYGIFDRGGLAFAELIKRQTPPRALVVHAPVHNDPVFLTGRRSLLGYPGHVWTHGLQFGPRELEIKKMYAGTPEADQLLRNNNIDYVVIGPLEKLIMPVNEAFFSRYRKVGEVGGYALYKIKP